MPEVRVQVRAGLRPGSPVFLRAFERNTQFTGEVAERLNALVLKTSKG